MENENLNNQPEQLPSDNAVPTPEFAPTIPQPSAIRCRKCGNEIDPATAFCPKCGAKLYVTTSKKKNVVIVSAIIVALAIVGICVGFFINNQRIETERLAAIEQTKVDYMVNLHEIMLTMLAGATDAEEVCNLTYKVWYNTIYEKYDGETDKYTRSDIMDGDFYDDFNASLGKLYRDQTIIETLSSIQANKAAVDTLMKKLQNPMDEYEACYETLTDMYHSYSQLLSLAASPNGSLQSYSEDFSTYDNDIIKHYDLLKTQIPDDAIPSREVDKDDKTSDTDPFSFARSTSSETKEFLDDMKRALQAHWEISSFSKSEKEQSEMDAEEATAFRASYLDAELDILNKYRNIDTKDTELKKMIQDYLDALDAQKGALKYIGWNNNKFEKTWDAAYETRCEIVLVLIENCGLEIDEKYLWIVDEMKDTLR